MRCFTSTSGRWKRGSCDGATAAAAEGVGAVAGTPGAPGSSAVKVGVPLGDESKPAASGPSAVKVGVPLDDETAPPALGTDGTAWPCGASEGGTGGAAAVTGAAPSG